MKTSTSLLALCATLLLCGACSKKTDDAPKADSPTPVADTTQQAAKPADEPAEEPAKPAEEPKVEAPKGDGVSGTYEATHQITEAGSPKNVSDCLELELKDDAIHLFVQNRGDDGELCKMNGIAKPFGKDHWRYKELEDEEEDMGCILHLKREGGAWKLEDQGGTCRAYYCNSNTNLDDHAFPLSSLKPGAKCERLEMQGAGEDGEYE